MCVACALCRVGSGPLWAAARSPSAGARAGLAHSGESRELAGSVRCEAAASLPPGDAASFAARQPGRMSAWSAVFWGAFSSASLYLGEALARPLAGAHKLTGLVMGFGAGTLLSAI